MGAGGGWIAQALGVIFPPLEPWVQAYNTATALERGDILGAVTSVVLNDKAINQATREFVSEAKQVYDVSQEGIEAYAKGYLIGQAENWVELGIKDIVNPDIIYAPDGTKIVTFSDGTKVMTLLDGTKVSTALNGTITQQGTDGVVTVIKDGVATRIEPTGSSLVLTPSNTGTDSAYLENNTPTNPSAAEDQSDYLGDAVSPGSVSETAATQIITDDGTIITMEADGTKIMLATDGTKTVISANGTQVVTQPDGTEIMTAPGGMEIVTQTDGTKIITEADGSKTVITADGKQTLYPADTAQVETRADGTQVVTEADGTQVVTSPDGTKTVISPDGTEKIYSSDGEQTETASDGTKTVTEADGTQTVIKPDGTQTVTSLDGTKTVTATDGTKTVWTIDGTETVYDMDGIKTVYEMDGTKTVYETDGNQTAYGTDGSRTVYGEDGSRTMYLVDGTIVFFDNDGNKTITTTGGDKTVITPDGTQTVYDTDGTTTVYGTDGTKTETATDGIITETQKDGTTTIFETDGSKTIYKATETIEVSPDGSKAVYGVDGTNTIYDTDGTITIYGSDGTAVIQPDGTKTVYGLDGSTTIYNTGGSVEVTAGEYAGTEDIPELSSDIMDVAHSNLGTTPMKTVTVDDKEYVVIGKGLYADKVAYDNAMGQATKDLESWLTAHQAVKAQIDKAFNDIDALMNKLQLDEHGNALQIQANVDILNQAVERYNAIMETSGAGEELTKILDKYTGQLEMVALPNVPVDTNDPLSKLPVCNIWTPTQGALGGADTATNAAFSSVVYHQSDSAEIPEGYRSIWYKNDDKTGYYAEAFTDGNKIVIAFKGTSNFSDAKSDIELAIGARVEQWDNVM